MMLIFRDWQRGKEPELIVIIIVIITIKTRRLPLKMKSPKTTFKTVNQATTSSDCELICLTILLGDLVEDEAPWPTIGPTYHGTINSKEHSSSSSSKSLSLQCLSSILLCCIACFIQTIGFSV